MKTLSSLIIVISAVLFNPSSLHCQYQWTDVEPLAPTQENSINLSLSHYGYVWEHVVDSATTAIYYQPLQYNLVCLALTPGVRYGNPYIDGTFSNCHVVFEGNPNGDKDIFYVVVDEMGNIIVEKQNLVASPADDHDFCFVKVGGIGKITWLEADMVKVGAIEQLSGNLLQLSEVTTIDAGNCSNPIVIDWNDKVYWTKQLDTIDVVRFSEPELSGGWSLPVNVDTASQIQLLDRSNAGYPIMHWTFTNDSTWFMKDYIFYGGGADILIPEVELAHPIDFDVFYNPPPVKDRIDIYDSEFFQSFTKLHNGYNEIFLNEEADPDNYYNFSNMGANCRNPQFFLGEPTGPYSYWFYLTWEATVDSTWQIYSSKIQVNWGGGGVGENQSTIKNISVSPNPFIDDIEIRFDLEKSIMVEIDILDTRGNFITTLLSENCGQGSFIKHISIPPTENYHGICFLRVRAGESFSYYKLIRVK
jgi:hypothetical protein